MLLKAFHRATELLQDLIERSLEPLAPTPEMRRVPVTSVETVVRKQISRQRSD